MFHCTCSALILVVGVDTESAFVCYQFVEVGCVAYISEELAASVFRVRVSVGLCRQVIVQTPEG